MNVDELRSLARAVEPLSAPAGDPLVREQVALHNNLVSGFRERVTRALNCLTLGKPVEPGLQYELRLMAKELPAMRRRVAASASRKLAVSGETGGAAGPAM